MPYADAMTMLVTVPELSLWAEGDATVIDPADPLAIWILNQASTLVMEEAGFLEWTAETAPGRAKIVVANVAKRCWNNADQELRSAIAGGPSSQVHEMAAYGMMLTEAEIVMIEKVVAALAEAAGGGTGFWTLSIGRGPLETNMYVPDDRWPQSSPINYMTPSSDPYYVPYDDALPPTNVPDEPLNTVL